MHGSGVGKGATHVLRMSNHSEPPMFDRKCVKMAGPGSEDGGAPLPEVLGVMPQSPT